MVKKPPPEPTDWKVLGLDHIVDGDTVDLLVSRPVGTVDQFTISAQGVIRVRSVHLDTPEKDEEGYAQATEDLVVFIQSALSYPGLRVTTQGKDSFGRYLGDVYFVNDRARTLSDYMVREKGWPVWAKS